MIVEKGRIQMQQYEKLFSEGQIGTVQLKNRVVMSPMVLGTGGLDGTPGEQMMQYYERRRGAYHHRGHTC